MQDREAFLPAFWRFAGKVLTAVLVGMIVAALIWWLAGWRTAAAFGEACQWAGLLSLIAGGASLMGQMEITRDFRYQQAESVSMGISERLNQRMREFASSYSFLITMALSGGFLLLLGVLLQAFFISAP